MAKKTNILKKNQDNVINILVLLVIFILLSLIIPAIGAGPSAPSFWIDIVVFFESVQTHFAAFWMFYSFAALVLFNFFSKKK